MMSWAAPFLGSGCLVLIAGFAAVNAFAVLSMPPPMLPQAQSGEQTAPSENNSSQQVRRVRSDEYYAAVTQRPLFAPTRRPVSFAVNMLNTPEPEIIIVSEEQAAPTTAEPPQLQLHGTMTSENGPTALLSLSGSDPEWQLIGTDIEGWKLGEIGNGWATLRNGEQTFKLDMY